MAISIMGVGTCNLACWEAREDVCRCQCGGRNHGIVRHGEASPGRFCRRKGVDYRLESIHAHYGEADAAKERASDALSQARGDGPLYVDRDGNPQWYTRKEYAFSQLAPAHAHKWGEVEAFLSTHPNRQGWQKPECYLVWKRTEEFRSGQ